MSVTEKIPFRFFVQVYGQTDVFNDVIRELHVLTGDIKLIEANSSQRVELLPRRGLPVEVSVPSTILAADLRRKRHALMSEIMKKYDATADEVEAFLVEWGARQ